MKKMTTVIAALLAALTAVSAAEAGLVSFAVVANPAPKDALNNALTGDTMILVIDLDNDGWNPGEAQTAAKVDYTAIVGPPADNFSGWLWDPYDVVVGRKSLTGGIQSLQFTNWSTVQGYTSGVDHAYAIFFDVAYSASATGPGEKKGYFAYDLGLVPNDPGGNLTKSVAVQCNRITNPEPATLVLLGLGGLGTLVARRRNRA
jgi:hypothetical protein